MSVGVVSMAGDGGRLTIGRIMVLVAAVAWVMAGVVELAKDGGLRVMMALGPGSPTILHLAFALALLLWWASALQLVQTLASAVGALRSRPRAARRRGRSSPEDPGDPPPTT